jgi:hypothetical protein
MDEMTAAVLMLPVAMGALGAWMDRSCKARREHSQKHMTMADHLTIVAERMGPPVDWEQFERRVGDHLKENNWRPISDELKRLSWEACMNWAGYGTPPPEDPKCEICGSTLEYDGFCTPCHLSPVERHVDRLESEKIELEQSLARTSSFHSETEEILVCRRCGEPMGRDIHEAGDTHGPTWWIDYPHNRLPPGQIKSCGGMLIIKTVPKIPPLNCTQCGKPMYGVSGDTCGVCVQINDQCLKTLRSYGVAEEAISELDWERLHGIANYLESTTPSQRSPAWFTDQIETMTREQLVEFHAAVETKRKELEAESNPFHRAEALKRSRPNRLERLPPR